MPRLARALAAPVASALLLVGCGGSEVWRESPDEAPRRWVAAVGAAQDARGPAGEAVTDTTVRMVLRPTASGTALRVRLENRFGETAVTFGGVSVGLRAAGAAVVPGTLRRVTFGGDLAVTLPPGARVTSDPVELPVQEQADLAVSLYVPGPEAPASGHRNALVTSYRTAAGAGDAVGEEGASPFVAATGWTLWVAGIDVLSTAAGAVVAFGSSSTEGVGATPDGYDRWTDRLARRLGERPAAERRAVVNAGIGGNTLLAWPSSPGAGPPGLERLDADALDLAGASHLILFHGSNDIARGAGADQVIAALEQVAARAAERGIAVVGATIGPRTYSNPAAMHAVRHAVNAWIREADAYRGVIDFDAVLRDPTDPDRLRPEYDSGDHVHPNPAGYAAMAAAIDLDLFVPVAAAGAP
ncbi:MAG TPA: GDSL-type esterase/lipase family protein [Thermodesulfobacteriota bacterium]